MVIYYFRPLGTYGNTRAVQYIIIMIQIVIRLPRTTASGEKTEIGGHVPIYRGWLAGLYNVRNKLKITIYNTNLKRIYTYIATIHLCSSDYNYMRLTV